MRKATSEKLIDAIDQRADEVDDALTAMNQIDMASRTVALQAAAAELTQPLNQLDARNLKDRGQ